jgi:hypothetical protein
VSSIMVKRCYFDDRICERVSAILLELTASIGMIPFFRCLFCMRLAWDFWESVNSGILIYKKVN